MFSVPWEGRGWGGGEGEPVTASVTQATLIASIFGSIVCWIFQLVLHSDHLNWTSYYIVIPFKVIGQTNTHLLKKCCLLIYLVLSKLYTIVHTASLSPSFFWQALKKTKRIEIYQSQPTFELWLICIELT